MGAAPEARCHCTATMEGSGHEASKGNGMGRGCHGSGRASWGIARPLTTRPAFRAAHLARACAVRHRDGCGRTTRRPRGARDCGEGSVRRLERGAGCGGGKTPRGVAGEAGSAKGGRAMTDAEKRGRGHSARGLDPTQQYGGGSRFGESLPVPCDEVAPGPKLFIGRKVDPLELVREEAPELTRHPVVRYEQTVLVRKADEVAVEEPMAVR